MAGPRRAIDGERLRRARNARWLTQKELAQKAGVAEHTVMRIERGQSPTPTRDTVFALADALDVRPEELLKSD